MTCALRVKFRVFAGVLIRGDLAYFEAAVTVFRRRKGHALGPTGECRQNTPSNREERYDQHEHQPARIPLCFTLTATKRVV
jgi:hypothetical protein